MDPVNIHKRVKECFESGPESTLARHFLETYLQSKGYSLEDIHSLPEDQAKTLMREACTYASLKLAEVEARARFTRVIQGWDR